MDDSDCGDLFPGAQNPEYVRFINTRCLMRTQDAHRVLVVSGIVLSQYSVEDRMAEAHAMVNLVEQGWASQVEVARAFGCTVRTVRRHQRRFEEGGLAALGHGNGYPNGRQRLHGGRRKLIQRLKGQGYSNREIARRMGVSETAVRKSLDRMGWKEAQAPEAQLPLDSAPGANPNLSGFAPASSVAPGPLTGAKREPKPVRFSRPQPRQQSCRPASRPAPGLPGLAGGCRSAVWLRPWHRAGGSVVGGSRSGAKRRLRIRPPSLWHAWAGILWLAHQFDDAAAHGALAD
jgi:transposase